MTLTRIGLGNFRRLPFPLPPAPEQDRIVSIVDEFMALCDRFDAARGERDRRVRFTITTLGRLTGQASESASFASSTTSALENISTLTAHSDQIRYLRQAVLALAVRGRLVRQDPSDVYFQSLLHRIHAASDLHRLKTKRHRSFGPSRMSDLSPRSRPIDVWPDYSVGGLSRHAY